MDFLLQPNTVCRIISLGANPDVTKRLAQMGILPGTEVNIVRVGPVTVNIFLRELRPYWRKADPMPLPIVDDMAKRVGLDLDRFNRKTVTFTRIEAGLIRLKRQLK